MTEYTVMLRCNDCKDPLAADGTFPSLELARIEAKNQGWEFVRVHRVELDFCPDCQVPAAMVAGR